MENIVNRNAINKIELFLDEVKMVKLKKIIKELYESKSIESERIEEFLKLNVFIIFTEYDTNKQSLNKFYRQNKELYRQNQ
jgi:hypothetical protein